MYFIRDGLLLYYYYLKIIWVNVRQFADSPNASAGKRRAVRVSGYTGNCVRARPNVIWSYIFGGDGRRVVCHISKLIGLRR